MPQATTKDLYDRDFYLGREQGLKAALAVARLVMGYAPVASVVDIGCATGTWLAAFAELGIARVCGIDGPWVARDLLQIPAESFVEAELDRSAIPNCGRFDLAMSLEVAEHLPASRADALIRALTEMSSLVLFSASIPHQPGAVNHINEQWPDYWVERFVERGYRPVDCIRRRIWSHPDIVPRYGYYAQNILPYADAGMLAGNEALRAEAAATARDALAIVHPSMYLANADPSTLTIDPKRAADYRSLTLGSVLPLIPILIGRSLARRIPMLRKGT
jgi:SAM-dependent methyltransferase